MVLIDRFLQSSAGGEWLPPLVCCSGPLGNIARVPPRHMTMKREGQHQRIQEEGPGAPLPPRLFQNHAVFRQFSGENPYFEQILG